MKRPFVEGSARNLGAVYGNLDQIDRDGRLIVRDCLDIVPTQHPKKSLQDCLQYDMFILPGASLIARSAFIKVGAFDERLSGYEDDDLFLRMFTAGFRLIYENVAVTRWRIYSGSTSFSARMAKSRMIYFKKQVDMFPDDVRLNYHWARDLIGPRFFKILFYEFVDGSRAHDLPRVERAWSDMKEVLPVMRRRVRRRVGLVGPLIDRFHRGRLQSLSRQVLRLALRRKIDTNKSGRFAIQF